MAKVFHPHQQFAFDWLSDRPRAVLAMDPRLGKTGVALRAIRARANVVCPAFLKQQWYDECLAWRPDLRPHIIRAGDMRIPRADVYIANFEILQDCPLAVTPELIVDEWHYCKGHDSKRTNTVLALAERAATFRALSGTVMPNRSIELWGLARALGATDLSAIEFGRRYSGGYIDDYGQWQFRGNTNSAELSEMVDPFMLRMRRADLGMLPNEWAVVALDLPLDVREREYSLAAIERNPTPIAFEGLSDLLRFQGERKIPYAVEYIVNLRRQDDGPMLVFAWHRDVIELLCMRLTQQLGLRVGGITGDTPHTERDRIVKLFQFGELDVLVGQIKAAGVGLPLHAAERVVFVEGRWTQAEMDQAADRGVSMDRPRSLRVDVLTIAGSIDEHMVRRCLEKQGVIDSIIRPTKEFLQWQTSTPLHSNRPQAPHSAPPRPPIAPRLTPSTPSPTPMTL